MNSSDRLSEPEASAKGSPSLTLQARTPSLALPGQDALRMKKLDRHNDWSIRSCLFELEGYNGWGYRMYHSTVLSPYLWSYTNHYTKGKYASDGKWDANLVSQQPGAAALLRVMVDSGVVFPIDYVGDWPTPDPTIAYA
jgi:lysozyme family protein